MLNDGNNDSLDCGLAGKCAGCPSASQGYKAHFAEKVNAVQELFPGAEIRYTPRSRVRDRVDLTWENVGGEMRLGLYELGNRVTLNMIECPMMSESLSNWFQDFRKQIPPIKKGSIRLRVSPSGDRGVWLDFANEDVKNLFEQKSYLEALSKMAFVEIGQRRKALEWRDGHPKLVDPILKPWFETYAADFSPIPLYGPVGGFSQVGFASNRALVGLVCDFVASSGVKSWLELFSGNGNFALALASRGHEVEAVELDELAVRGLHLSMDPEKPIQVSRADVYLKTKSLPALEGRGLLVDPPRAGLRELLPMLATGPRPQSLLYVSCFTDVLLSDTLKLQEMGYKLEKLEGVDQFPFSPHNEWVALFKC